MTVALSRARLGLYILGRREIFETCFELRQAFAILLQRPDKLMLVTGELWPSSRILKEEENTEVTGQAQMENVEHLGQYVYEMTNSKVQQLRAQRGLEEAPLIEAPFEDIVDLETIQEEELQPEMYDDGEDEEGEEE